MIRTQLPACRWRGRPVAPGEYTCGSTQAVLARDVATMTDCLGCSVRDHPPEPSQGAMLAGAGAVRHLIYHCYPFGGEWHPNLQALRRRISLFNGRRLVAVATGPGTVGLEEVRQELDGCDCEFLPFVNDPGLREMVSYPALLRAIAPYAAEKDVHWYGHAKGVTSVRWAPAVREWRDAMYEAQLDHWPLMAGLLRQFAAVGQFIRPRHLIPGSPCRWHYSGCFSWRRHLPLFRLAWDNYDVHWCGSESHLGRLYRAGEVSNLYGERPPAGLDLYLPDVWEKGLRQAHAAWCEANATSRQAPLLATVILTAARQAELVHQAIGSVLAQTSPDWQLLVVDAGPLSAAGSYDRYSHDARVQVMPTGETDALRRCTCIQGWSINEAWRRGRVRGDVICCLSDDDVLDPEWIGRVIGLARDRGGENAWVGPAERTILREGMDEVAVGRLTVDGVYGPGRPLRCHADGMQLAVRRTAWRSWPEAPGLASEADGHWMDRVAAEAPVYAIKDLVGRHRHTPLSAFTRPDTLGVKV